MKAVRRCQVEGCTRPHVALDFCGTHYAAHRRGTLPGYQPRPHRYEYQQRIKQRGETCTGPDCDRPAAALDLCHGHYQQRRDGRPLAPLRRSAPSGQVADLVRWAKEVLARYEPDALA